VLEDRFVIRCGQANRMEVYNLVAVVASDRPRSQLLCHHKLYTLRRTHNLPNDNILYSDYTAMLAGGGAEAVETYL